jgi:hypothetical protein
MSPEEPIDDAAHLFDLEKEMASIVRNIPAGDPRGEREVSSDLVCAIVQPKVAADEIKIDRTDRASIAAQEREGFAIRAGLIASAAITACGLAWIVVGSLVPPSGHVRSELLAKAPSASSSIFDATKADRLQGSGAGSGTRERSEGAKAEPAPKLSGSLPDSSRKRVVASVPATMPSTSKRPPLAQQHPASIESRTAQPAPPRPAPVPETPPGTIEGWTVREVVNGTAVLEGPDGVWRAAAGGTVPSLGRVESVLRWGNRWIVATSSGLVSTP